MTRTKITTRCEQGVLPPLTSITRPMVKAWSASGGKQVSLRVFPYAKTVSVSVGGFARKNEAVAAVRKALAAVMLALCLVLASCTGLSGRDTIVAGVERTPEQVCVEQCQHYDDAYLVYYALGLTFSGATAATGTGGVLTATLGDDQAADIALAATSAGSGIATVVFNWLAGQQKDRYEECTARCRAESQ